MASVAQQDRSEMEFDEAALSLAGISSREGVAAALCALENDGLMIESPDPAWGLTRLRDSPPAPMSFSWGTAWSLRAS
jgi:hypothetical protein